MNEELTTVRCNLCKEDKSVEDFYLTKGLLKDKRCKACRRAKRMEMYNLDPDLSREEAKIWRDRNIKATQKFHRRKYQKLKINPEKYGRMLARNNVNVLRRKYSVVKDWLEFVGYKASSINSVVDSSKLIDHIKYVVKVDKIRKRLDKPNLLVYRNEKLCNICLEVKVNSLFNKRTDGEPDSKCRVCKNIKSRKYDQKRRLSKDDN